MNYFDFNTKEITESELEKLTTELLANSTLKIGDTVKLKGDKNAPIMAVTGTEVAQINLFQYGKLARRYIKVNCVWFNKSRQEFGYVSFAAMCLEITDVK